MLSIINLILFLAVTGYAIYLFARIVYSRYTFIKLGQPSDSKRDMKESMREILINGFGQKKLLKDRKSGIMHIVMFYGFIILQFGALDLIYKGFSNGNHLPLIPGYRYFTFMQEIVTALVLIAVLYAGYRRFIEKLPRLKRGWKASLVIFFIGGLMLSIIFSAASEAVWKGHEAAWTTPVSSVVAAGLGFMSEGTAQVAFYIFWWMHLLILLSFLVYVPQSKHFHIFVAPINLFWKRQGPVGKLSTIDFSDESVEEYGKGKIEDFTQKQLIDLYACVECGRCTNMCPASGTGKMLSPMQLIVKMRDHLTEKGAAITSQTAWMPAFAFPNSNAVAETAATSEGPEHPKAKVLDQIQLIGDV
ncbi:MAG: (Fe-S)-binding protein, partial [Bacilli bacterium]